MSDQQNTRAATLSAALPAETEQLAHALLRKAVERNQTLATAESCTGGLLASLLTDVEGVSHAFERGFVVYTKEAKIEMLGVDAGLIERHGVVSRSVAIAMAEGALAGGHADVAVAITGYAGSSAEGEEAGLVHIAAAARRGETRHQEHRFGAIGRGGVRRRTIHAALQLMLDQLMLHE